LVSYISCRRCTGGRGTTPKAGGKAGTEKKDQQGKIKADTKVDALVEKGKNKAQRENTQKTNPKIRI